MNKPISWIYISFGTVIKILIHRFELLIKPFWVELWRNTDHFHECIPSVVVETCLLAWIQSIFRKYRKIARALLFLCNELWIFDVQRHKMNFTVNFSSKSKIKIFDRNEKKTIHAKYKKKEKKWANRKPVLHHVTLIGTNNPIENNLWESIFLSLRSARWKM